MLPQNEFENDGRCELIFTRLGHYLLQVGQSLLEQVGGILVVRDVRDVLHTQLALHPALPLFLNVSELRVDPLVILDNMGEDDSPRQAAHISLVVIAEVLGVGAQAINISILVFESHFPSVF